MPYETQRYRNDFCWIYNTPSPPSPALVPLWATFADTPSVQHVLGTRYTPQATSQALRVIPERQKGELTFVWWFLQIGIRGLIAIPRMDSPSACTGGLTLGENEHSKRFPPCLTRPFFFPHHLFPPLTPSSFFCRWGLGSGGRGALISAPLLSFDLRTPR